MPCVVRCFSYFFGLVGNLKEFIMTILWSFEAQVRGEKMGKCKEKWGPLVKLQVTVEAEPGPHYLAVKYFSKALHLRCFRRSWSRLCITCKIARPENQRSISKYFEIFQGSLSSVMLVYFLVFCIGILVREKNIYVKKIFVW